MMIPPEMEHVFQDAGVDTRTSKANGHGQAGTGPRFKLIPFADLKSTTTPSYLVKGLIPRVGMALVWGPPKCGKSFWVFDLVMHVALNGHIAVGASIPAQSCTAPLKVRPALTIEPKPSATNTTCRRRHSIWCRRW